MVMVSHTHEFIFIKTHKTASTSVEVFLEPFCAPPGHVPQLSSKGLISDYGIVGMRQAKLGPKAFRPIWRGHIGARRISENLPDYMFDDYTKITTVRNPFDRAVSRFLFRRHFQNLEQPRTLPEAQALFTEFLNSDGYQSDCNRVHIEGKYVIDHAVRYEHLSADLEALAASLGLDIGKTELPHFHDNKSAKRDWSTADFFADPANVARVLEVDAWMFERCGYSPNPRDADAGASATSPAEGVQ